MVCGLLQKKVKFLIPKNLIYFILFKFDLLIVFTCQFYLRKLVKYFINSYLFISLFAALAQRQRNFLARNGTGFDLRHGGPVPSQHREEL